MNKRRSVGRREEINLNIALYILLEKATLSVHAQRWYIIYKNNMLGQYDGAEPKYNSIPRAVLMATAQRKNTTNTTDCPS